MINLLKKEALVHGDRLQIVSIERLQNLKDEIEAFKESEELNGFQRWITDSIYKFEIPPFEFEIKSVIIVAIPHPAYARTEFNKQGKKYTFVSPVTSSFAKTEKYIMEILASKNYHLKTATNLPLKRLAVKAGLAVYGRNNICYVEGMGSFLSFAAYFSDIPCDRDGWVEVRNADKCVSCSICLNSCPTGAIRESRFLIDNERCLSLFNENTVDFPEWLPLSVHHCLYDCLKCQISCPMNKEYVNNVMEQIEFSEAETEMLLTGCSVDAFSASLKQKAEILGFDRWLGAIPRNLKVLFELSEQRL